MPKTIRCALCNKISKPNSRRKVWSGGFKKHLERCMSRKLTSEDIVCSGCTARYYKSLKIKTTSSNNSLPSSTSSDPNYQVPTENSQSIQSPKSIHLNITSTPRSHKYCVVCQKYGNARHRLISIPAKARTQAFIEKGIFIDHSNRCCATHVQDSFFNTISLNLLKGTKTSDLLSRTDITDLLNNVRSFMKTSFHLNFDLPSLLSEDAYIELTGLTKEQFSDLSTYLTSVRSTAVRSIRTCLAILLVKLKTGLSNKLLAILFGLKKSQIQRCVHSARAALIDNFVPHHLGFGHITHEDFVKQHTTNTAKTLFSSGSGNEAIVILDGTYIYIQKSSSYQFQRRSFSLHKHRLLVKPMVIVGSDGYILSVLGPYLADEKNNDAAITKHMFVNNIESISDWFNEQDVCIVDRGFRDAVTFLETKGYRVEMPAYLNKGPKQHSTEDANNSRLVSKVRWIVEGVNGRIKQFKMMEKVMPNQYISCIRDFVRIICAILNKYKKPLATSDALTEELASKMMLKASEGNHLLTTLQQSNLLNKRSVYTSISASSDMFNDFPVLSNEDLRNITFGVYQIKQAPFYVREHTSDDGDYELFFCKDDANLLKVKIQSRHSNSVIHSIWIQYSSELEDSEPIKGWYCTCKAGARVVGCCAHIASALWYMGFSRHQSTEYGKRQQTGYILDAADMPETDSESSDDSTTEE